MSIEAEQLILNIIRPTLAYLGAWTPENECLLAGTAAQETGFSLDKGKGLGIYAISREKHRYIWDQYLAFQPELASQIRGLASQRAFLTNPELELVSNLAYATAIAWMIYQESGLKSGSYNNLKKQAKAWQLYFHPTEIAQENNYCQTFVKLVSVINQSTCKEFAA